MPETTLAGPTGLTTSAATVYTVPGGKTAQVEQIRVENSHPDPVAFTLSFGADDPGTRLFDAVSIPGHTAYSFLRAHSGAPFTPLAAADVIQAFGSLPDKLTLTIDGEEV